MAPQSTSDSPPFLTRSEHVGAAHLPPAPHTPEAQSAALEQRAPTPQGSQPEGEEEARAAPPQSTSVSPALRTPSTQVAGMQTPCAEQTREEQSAADEQSAPSPQGVVPGQAVAPQSTSVSSPFFTPSEHEGAAHVPLTPQTRETQSVAVKQRAPALQGSQPEEAPPQSTSVSPALRTPSTHVGATQTPPCAEQTPEEQSAAEVQRKLSLHKAPGHAEAPQSTSASPPFLTPSEHDGAAHRPSPPQTREAQSIADAQRKPTAQGGDPGHAAAPQSTSVSPAFFKPSEQVGTAHAPLAPQTPEAQSAAEEQAKPSLHSAPGQAAAPQSTSVSSPFLTPSEHVGAAQAPSPPQTPDEQSAAVEQSAPAPQGSQPEAGAPPQSTSVSPALRTPSTQVGATQTP